jgi:hypothetical protein
MGYAPLLRLCYERDEGSAVVPDPQPLPSLPSFAAPGAVIFK